MDTLEFSGPKVSLLKKKDLRQQLEMCKQKDLLLKLNRP
jgi:ABC-type iron transport system FetAB ATPase subunit